MYSLGVLALVGVDIGICAVSDTPLVSTAYLMEFVYLLNDIGLRIVQWHVAAARGF